MAGAAPCRDPRCRELGYTGEVLFPVKVQVEDPDLDASAELKLVLYACSTICIREERVLRRICRVRPAPVRRP